MEDLSFAQLDHATLYSHDDAAGGSMPAVARATKAPSPVDRATNLMDGLSAYAAVFGCPAGCRTAR